MQQIFTPISFGRLQLRNRIVMAPMTRRKAKKDGIPTPEIVEYYKRRAQGEVGLIISEGTGIDSFHAYDTLTVPRFENDDQLAGWEQVVNAIHAEGSAFAPQLWHTGRFADNPIGPSACKMPERGDGTLRPEVQEMSEHHFAQVLEAYINAAKNAEDIGCDAIEIHGAHGYLLDSFLSPVTNQRQDQYGGSLENRLRFPIEVVKAIRSAVAKDFPIIYRFSQWQLDDYNQLKFQNPQELQVWTDALKNAGVDILHVSTYDATAPGFPSVNDKTLCGWTKELSGLSCIAVGKVAVSLTFNNAYGEEQDEISSPQPAFDLVKNGEADLIAVGRSLIANPDWVKIVKRGDWKQLRSFNKDLLKDLI
ncbi:12-oxophytodienoate reductase [Candidatus Uabimicrobium sp. HlEnr_7]|uniref:oxidoreductase n=1 Tax=Candidatus Uabimicrobium helgolandensis TaxID=3095367 RepID=UPI00355821EE